MDSQPPVEPDANYGGVTLSQLEEFLAVRKGPLTKECLICTGTGVPYSI